MKQPMRFTYQQLMESFPEYVHIFTTDTLPQPKYQAGEIVSVRVIGTRAVSRRKILGYEYLFVFGTMNILYTGEYQQTSNYLTQCKFTENEIVES